MSLAGQFSAVYAHEGYDLFKFVGKFLFPSLVILIKGSENLEKERERSDMALFLYLFFKTTKSSTFQQQMRVNCPYDKSEPQT